MINSCSVQIFVYMYKKWAYDCVCVHMFVNIRFTYTHHARTYFHVYMRTKSYACTNTYQHSSVCSFVWLYICLWVMHCFYMYTPLHTSALIFCDCYCTWANFLLYTYIFNIRLRMMILVMTTILYTYIFNIRLRMKMRVTAPTIWSETIDATYCTTLCQLLMSLYII